MANDGNITRLNNLLDSYRNHMIQNCTVKKQELYSTKDKGDIVTNCIETVDNSINTLKRYLNG